MSPSAGGPGTLVTITGSNFGDATGAVQISGTEASVQSWSAESILVQVPSLLSAGSTTLLVKTSMESSNPMHFLVEELSITSLSSTSGAVGTPIRLRKVFSATRSWLVRRIAGDGRTGFNDARRSRPSALTFSNSKLMTSTAEAKRRRPLLRQMGIDEIYRGKQGKFLTVVCNLETAEPLWFGRERKQETLDDFFRSQLVSRQRKRIEAACVDMWEPFRLSLEEGVPGCRIIYDKFHILQHANDAVDEVRRAEFFRKGRKMRDVIKGKKWLLLSRWKNLAKNQRGVLNRVFQLNRRVFKAYLLKESLEQLWDYRYEGAMINYLKKWMDQLRWQRLPSFQKLAEMLLKHLDGILNYCRARVRFGVVEAINGNIRMLINRGRGYKNMRYLLLKARRMAVTNTEYVAFQKTRKAA